MGLIVVIAVCVRYDVCRYSATLARQEEEVRCLMDVLRAREVQGIEEGTGGGRKRVSGDMEGGMDGHTHGHNTDKEKGSKKDKDKYPDGTALRQVHKLSMSVEGSEGDAEKVSKSAKTSENSSPQQKVPPPAPKAVPPAAGASTPVPHAPSPPPPTTITPVVVAAPARPKTDPGNGSGAVPAVGVDGTSGCASCGEEPYGLMVSSGLTTCFAVMVPLVTPLLYCLKLYAISIY